MIASVTAPSTLSRATIGTTIQDRAPSWRNSWSCCSSSAACSRSADVAGETSVGRRERTTAGTLRGALALGP